MGWTDAGLTRHVEGGLAGGLVTFGLLALMVLGVCAKIGIDLVSTPEDVYSISETPGFGL